MSITYNSTTKTITVSSETNCNFEALYQASVAGGWGVIQKLDDAYVFSAKIYLLSNTTFLDEGKVIILDGATLPNNETDEIWINVANGCTLTLGEITNTTNKVGKNGCMLYFKNSPSSSYRSVVENYGTIYLYGCAIKTESNSRNQVLLRAQGKWVAWNTMFDGGSLIAFDAMNNINNEFVNCIFNNIIHWSSIMYMVDSTVILPAIEYGVNNLIYRNCKIINTTVGYFRDGGAAYKVYVWDSTATNWTSTYCYNNAKNQIYRGYSFKPTILDINKTPIQNANIKLYDKNHTLIVDANTNSSGTIIPVDIVENSWIAQGLPTNNYIVTENYNPFTLVISKDGYETYTSTFDLTEKYRSVITLTPPKIIYIDKITVIEKLNSKILDETLRANIIEEKITTEITNEVL